MRDYKDYNDYDNYDYKDYNSKQYECEIEIKIENHKTIEILGYRKCLNVEIYKWLSIDKSGDVYVFSEKPTLDLTYNEWVNYNTEFAYLTNIAEYALPLPSDYYFDLNNPNLSIKNWQELIFKIEDLII